jgi:Zn-dependent protease
MALVALAGPGSNALQATVWMAVGYVLPVLGMQSHGFLPRVCQAGVLSNLVMFAFNLFPMLPLDGGRILAGLLPPQWAARFSRIEPFGFYIVMALVMMRVITTWWMLPVITLTLHAIEALLSPLRFLLS